MNKYNKIKIIFNSWIFNKINNNKLMIKIINKKIKNNKKLFKKII